MKQIRIWFVIMLTVTMIFSNTFSAFAAKAKLRSGSPPVAYGLSISGNPVVGQTLIGSYIYYDANGDIQGASKFRWLSSTSLIGTYNAITGAVNKTYTLTSSDTGKYIKFEVTPVSATGTPNTGSPVLSSATGPITSPSSSSSKIVLGFATKYYSSDVSSYNSMVNNTKSIDQIATVTYSADSFGNLIGTAPNDQITYANNNGIKPFALVNNADSSGFNASIAKSILENPTYKQCFINNLVNNIQANGYVGANIDFENVPSADRTYYSQFIFDIKNTLAPLGYKLAVSVPAKTVDSTTYSWTWAYDYKIIGTYADYVVLMTYDEHGPWCCPGPVASISWVTNVVNYAKTVIPANKIILGLAAYGYDWSSVGNTSLSVNKASSLASTYGSSIQWDSVAQVPYYNYTLNGVIHTVYFENEYSIAFKLNLVNQNSLAGVGIWRLGLENPAYWNTINTKLNK